MTTTQKRIAWVTLRDDRGPDGSLKSLDAYVEEGGDLVLSGYDRGATVKEFSGGSHYEYWRRVKREHVPTVLLQLIEDRFSSDVAFHEWRKEKGIPNEFSIWV
jgi:hypothetical protein